MASGESTRLPLLDPGSIPGLGVICGMSLLLVLVLAPRGFCPSTPDFPFPQKPTFLNSNSIWIVSLSQQEFGTHLFQNFAITFNFSYHFDISSLSFIVIIIIIIIIISFIIIIIINLWISIFLGIF